jgi:hypothetical protein
MINGKRREFLQISNIVAYIIMILFNALSGTGIFNGRTIGGNSDKYPNLFTPAGITFSIWSVIYLFLLIYVLYKARDVFKSQKEDMLYLEQISIFFILSCVFNILWLIVWLYEFILLSLIIMILLLLSLIVIYLRLNIAIGDLKKQDKIILWTPFSLYLGWITVASIANSTVFLVSINWDRFGIPPFTWTVIVIIVALFLTLIILYSRKDFIYPLVTIWALIGIIIKRISDNYDLAIVALFMIIIISANVLYLLIKEYR